MICTRAGRMTWEDVFPNWLRSAEIERHVSDVAPGFTRIKLRVCERCNAEMNRQFEIPVRDLILRMRTGRTMLLSPDDQNLLSKWSLKTELLRSIHRTAVLGHETRSAYDDITPAGAVAEWRRRVHRLIYWAEIPNLCLVRIGMFGDLSKPTHAIDSFLPEPWRLRRNVLSTVDQHGPLLFEIAVLLEDRDEIVDWSRANCRHLTVVHPGSSGSVQWPPGRRLRRLDAVALGVVWQHKHPVPYIDRTRLPKQEN